MVDHKQAVFQKHISCNPAKFDLLVRVVQKAIVAWILVYV